MLSKLNNRLPNLVMFTIDNNGAVTYLHKGRDCAQFLINVYATVEYLNRNASIALLFQYISKSNMVCARSVQAKYTKKTYDKET